MTVMIKSNRKNKINLVFNGIIEYRTWIANYQINNS